MGLEETLHSLNAELEQANMELETLISGDIEQDLSDEVEHLTDKINRIVNEIASIMDAIEY